MKQKVAWWLMGCPFTRLRYALRLGRTHRDFGDEGWVPWDYKLGMRLSAS